MEEEEGDEAAAYSYRAVRGLANVRGGGHKDASTCASDVRLGNVLIDT